jgi:abortive infection bacteriophage resistance protein
MCVIILPNSFLTIPKALLASFCFLAKRIFGYCLIVKLIIKTQNGSENKTNIQNTIFSHSQYNHIG